MDCPVSQPISQAADQAFFSSLKEETHFYIVRHGQSEGNAKRVFQGRLDMPLDDTGRVQARSLGVWLAAQGVGKVLSSPLERAAQTGRIIASACGIEAELADDLQEIDTGVFSGLSNEQSRARYPAVFASFEGNSWDVVPGAEKAEALYVRAMSSWRVLRDRALSGNRAIACVSHGGFIQWLFRATYGSRAWMPPVPTPNCGVLELVIEPNADGSIYMEWVRVGFQAPEPPSSSTSV
jgi:broad specificity phosphatase PhoE